tara:strand:- start:582 stop:1637 length:1056 start_codon:yes stop_codon:yes gene_type:complete
MKRDRKKINVIYICTAEKGPSGGAKIIYKHSEIINNLKKNFTSQVIHIKKNKSSKWKGSLSKILKLNNSKFYGWDFRDIGVSKNFKYRWFDNKINIKNDFMLNKNYDFVIIPEIFAHFAEPLLIKKKIPYAIFVQNGYCLEPTNNYAALDLAYTKAKFIISYSEDITKCISIAFPNCKNKIFKTSYSIDNKKFNTSIKKKNIITFMPRKLPEHSKHLLFFLRKKLPSNWVVKPLHNLKEKDVYTYLLKSKIFLSFSYLEGLPLPPVEAAIAGNKVIGYTGEGGKEYWKSPVFTEIQNGDMSKFVGEIIGSLKNKKNSKFYEVRNKLIQKFSTENEQKNMKKMLKRIASFMF